MKQNLIKTIQRYKTQDVDKSIIHRFLLAFSPWKTPMSSRVVIALFLFLICTNCLVSAAFQHNMLNKHISLQYQNIFQIENDNQTVSASSKKSIHSTVPKKYGPFFMTVPLDHFRNTTSATFQNRYWVNSDFYKPKGPIICKYSLPIIIFIQHMF